MTPRIIKIDENAPANDTAAGAPEVLDVAAACDGQPVTGWDEVRAYALARGYLRWYRPGEIAP